MMIERVDLEHRPEEDDVLEANGNCNCGCPCACTGNDQAMDSKNDKQMEFTGDLMNFNG